MLTREDRFWQKVDKRGDSQWTRTNPEKHNCGRGERHGHTTLTGEQVAEIRTAEGTQRTLATRYGCSQATISNIKKGKTWRGNKSWKS